jgi:phosphatidylinositol glycan class T
MQSDEELSIKTLEDGKVATYFSVVARFHTKTSHDVRCQRYLYMCVVSRPTRYLLLMMDSHGPTLSLALGQILREYAVTELHLTLKAGNWNYERWRTSQAAAPGGELWAWMGRHQNLSG